jgi:hypothetical protein
MYPSTKLKPVWVGQSTGAPRVFPVVIEHRNGFEPAVLHAVDACYWRKVAPYRLSLQDAAQWARDMASHQFALYRARKDS